MIDIHNFWSTKYQWPEVYIFAPEYEFDWTIKTAKNFVKKVHIRCYWVLAAPGMPYMFKCREDKQSKMTHHRLDSEIFNTFEECLEHYEKSFDNKWKEVVRSNLTRSISYSENAIKERKKLLNNQKKQLEAFEKLLA